MPTLQLDPTLTSPSVARQWLATHLRDRPLRVVESATLLISELVTNAVLHARSQICISLDSGADLIRVEVADANATFPWISEPQSADANVGKGLGVVEVISSNWGVRRTQGGKVVWFELRCE